MKRFVKSIASVVLIAASVVSLAAFQGIEAQLHKEPVPQEVAAPVAATLIAGGVRAVASGVTIDFWWVKGLQVSAAPATWAAVAEGSLVGAARIGGDFRDIRGRVIRAGVYTLRYAVQPDNGDHLGTSPFRDFLLLVPAALDTGAAPLGHDGTVDLSKRTVGGSHPAVWSIDPPMTAEAVSGKHTTELGHQAVIVEVPCVRDGAAVGGLRFGIVLIGRIDA